MSYSAKGKVEKRRESEYIAHVLVEKKEAGKYGGKN